MWDLESGDVIDRRQLDIPRTMWTMSVLTPNGRHLIVAADRMRAWDLDSWELVADVQGREIAGRGLAVSRDGSLLATSHSRDVVRLWTVPSLTEIARWYLPDLGCRDLACAVAFTPDNAGLIVAGWEGVIRRIALPARALSANVVVNLLDGYARGLVVGADDC